MSFKLLHAAINYNQHLSAIESGGLCLGQCWIWMSDIITGSVGTLVPASFFKGGRLQKQYEAASGSDSKFYIRKGAELIASAPGNGLIQRNAVGNACSFEMINAFRAGAAGDAAMIMTWDISTDKNKSRGRSRSYDSGHALALLRLNYNGKKIYFYDPNYGVYEWIETAGVDLYTDIERFMLEESDRVAVAVQCVSMFSRQGAAFLNFEHVIV